MRPLIIDDDVGLSGCVSFKRDSTSLKILLQASERHGAVNVGGRSAINDVGDLFLDLNCRRPVKKHFELSFHGNTPFTLHAALGAAFGIKPNWTLRKVNNAASRGIAAELGGAS